MLLDMICPRRAVRPPKACSSDAMAWFSAGVALFIVALEVTAARIAATARLVFCACRFRFAWFTGLGSAR
jgi:hypothetical protein